MIINMAGGGGGAALNFKVVTGLTQPGTASENTIWVKTERIGAWYFSATQPEGLQEWDVWFEIGTKSDFAFNALRKNGLQVYPLSTNQYVSGAWVGKTAMSYQNGEWVDWIPTGALYWNGYDNEKLTGGITFKQTGSYTLGKGSNNGSCIALEFGPNGGVTAIAPNKINLTDFNTLKINVTKCTIDNSTSFADIGIANRNGTSFDTAASNIVANKNFYSTGEILLDVSTLVGEYYLYVRTWAWNTSSGTKYVEFTKWVVE